MPRAIVRSVALAAVFLGATGCSSTESVQHRQEPPRSYVGHGTLVSEPGEPLRLCTNMYAMTGEMALTCTFGIEVAGVEVDALPTVKTEKGLTVVDDARLVGTWDGTTLTVTQPVEVDAPRSPPPPSAPTFPGCPDDGDGDPPDIPEDFEAWKRYSDALDAFARDNPDLYAGRWASNGSTVEQVVALTDDSDANRATVAAVYPWACVVHRPNSEAGLLDLQAELQLADLPNRNRVIGSGTSPLTSTLNVIVLFRDDPTEQWLADRYGDRVVIEDAAVLEPL